MVSFSPKDVIFLLNKWETLSLNDANEQEEFFKETKKSLQKTWKEVDEDCIFRISAKKVPTFHITSKETRIVKVFFVILETVIKSLYSHVDACRSNNKIEEGYVFHIFFLKGWGGSDIYFPNNFLM